ncbi:MAG: DUF2167 domain-containing protein [Nevskiaceae bacterium]|nr:DUF2167 domain-containing protein [Nevskiaceae bacterium]
MRMLRQAWTRITVACLMGAFFAVPGLSQTAAEAELDQDEASQAEQEFLDQLRALDWVHGPATVNVPGNSTLKVPEGYMFLDEAGTEQYLELTENLSDGSEVLLTPDDFTWSAYLSFSDDGYVKDDEKIDAPALLESLQAATEAGNRERRARGWSLLHVAGWASEPAYNSTTKRLEWATDLRSDDGQNVNFFTKILGRRGHTSVVLAAAPEDLAQASAQLNTILEDYQFNPGDSYAEYRPGDKVAQYGLAALVLGGAAAIATKKGFWAVLAGFFATAWKFIAVAAVAVGAWLKRVLFGRSGKEV